MLVWGPTMGAGTSCVFHTLAFEEGLPCLVRG